MTARKQVAYDEKAIKTLDALEHIRLRTGMYIGRLGDGVDHLAGALGRPVWGLIPYSPDWRWMLNRDDSPWYPTLRLFRQTTPGDWQGVFERVTQALQEQVG